MAAVAGGGGAARALSQREQDIQMMLAADVHLGTKNCDFQMERYVFKRRTDGSGGARVRPNMLVTGTPGTGKTTTCSLLADATGLRHVNIGDLVREKGLHDGWDEDLDCHIINEDMVCDELEDMMKEGGILVDYHGCEFFPKRWFDLVVVLQTDNSILHDRLTSRGYMGAKLANNIECEIFQVLLEEARESYKEEIVMPLRSDNVEDVSRNVGTLTEWINNWRPPR